MSKIIIWGEFPPNTHTGISICNQMVYNYLNEAGQQIEIVEEYSWNKKRFRKIRHNIHNYKNIIRLINKLKPSIFYYNIPLSLFGLLKILLPLPVINSLTGKPKTIGHIHRGDIQQFLTRSLVNRLLFRLALIATDEVLVLSKTYINDIMKFRKNTLVKVLFNTSQFESEKPKQPLQYKRNFVCISNYIKSKGLNELVECFSQPELQDLKLDIYGNSYDIDFKKFLFKIKTNNIYLHDSLPRKDFVDTLQRYDCLILPSWNEGQPIIILEAMSMAVAVIATRVGDVSNMLGPDYPFIAEPADKNSLKNKILKFDNYNQKESLANELHSRYQLKYSNAKFKREVLSIFK